MRIKLKHKESNLIYEVIDKYTDKQGLRVYVLKSESGEVKIINVLMLYIYEVNTYE